MMRYPELRSVLSSTVAIYAMAIATPALAQAKSFNVPAQPAISAIPELARQADVQILVSESAVRGKKTRAVKGSMTVEQALRQLLKGTGLRVSSGDGRTFTLAPADEKGAKIGDKDGETADEAGMPDILVTGRRSLNVDVRRTRDDPQPYVVFTEDDIKKSPATDLDEFLKTKLTANTSNSTGSQRNSAIGSVSSITLRGLSAAQTVILVDGRRLADIINSGSPLQPDISSIPLSSIERIEVLPSTASGIFGGSATGGVINIITKKDYKGLDVSAGYGESFRGDAQNYRIDATGGLSLEGGRTHITASGSFAKMDPLFYGGRDFIERSRALLIKNNPAAFYNTPSPPLGYTSNIRSADGTNLVLKNGTSLNSPITFVPAGYAGPGSDGGAALVPNAGLFSAALPNSTLGTQAPILNATKRSSLSFDVRREFTNNLQIFGDISWNKTRTSVAIASSTYSTTLAPSAANNPFNNTILVTFPVIGPSSVNNTEADTLRLLGGAILKLPFNWVASADYGWTRSRLSYAYVYPITGDPDGSGPGLSDTAALANGTLNVLRDINAYPLNWGPYLLPKPMNGYSGTDELGDATLRLSGPLFNLPGGATILSGLVERRVQRADDSYGYSTSGSGVRTTTWYPNTSQTVMSYAGEARFPILAPANGVPFIHSLELQTSIRYDRYSTDAPLPTSTALPAGGTPLPVISRVHGEVAKAVYTIGGSFAPTSDIKFRASFSTGFLPASVSQIVPSPPNTYTLTITDPKRGNLSETIPITIIAGGSPSLKPETSKSLSAGVILTPSIVKNLRISVDYTKITKSNEITGLSYNDIISAEDQFPGRVLRNPLTPQDAALGYTGGVINTIDQSQLNFAKTRLTAIDIQADYSFDTARVGSFHLYGLASYEPELRRKVLPGQPFLNSVGLLDGPVKWRGNFGLDWTKGNVSVNYGAQFYGSYLVYRSTATPSTIASTILNQGSSRIPFQMYHDISVTYKFSAADSGSPLHGLEMTLGVQDLFDKQPPIFANASTSSGSIYSVYGDPRLRRFSLMVKKHF